MALTLSHQSALDVVRTLRSEGNNLHEFDSIPLTKPTPWVGERWTSGKFNPDVWRWSRPTPAQPLHAFAYAGSGRMRGALIREHTLRAELPSGSVLWLDEQSSIVCPELLFLQMAECFSMPALVMLGYELCGHYSRSAREPSSGEVTDGIPASTNVTSIKQYLAGFKWTRGLGFARKALRHVCDDAISVPEAVLATMYSLPSSESGHGLGPVTLNERVQVDDSGRWERSRSRYPDLMFSFAPVGLNYDGSKHFDVTDLMIAAETFAHADEGSRDEAREALREKITATRTKIVDDNTRNRQLAARGRIVFPVTKEDLSDGKHLDELTEQVLGCAHEVFDVDVSDFRRSLNDTSLTRDRWDMLERLQARGADGKSSYGKI